MEDMKKVSMGLSISDPEEALLVVIGLVGDGVSEPVLKVEAHGFEESDAGALEVAELLENMAGGIRDRLGKPRGAEDKPVSEGVKPVRPRFNPRPTGGQKA